MTTAELQLEESMSYELGWHIPDEVLLLTLSGDYPVNEAKEVNRLILDQLQQADKQLSVLIDAMALNRPYNFSEIRAVQTFMDHDKLAHIYVSAGDRLVRLAMMVIFNFSRAYLHLYDNLGQAKLVLERQNNRTY
jgi:hypothetical protein